MSVSEDLEKSVKEAWKWTAGTIIWGLISLGFVMFLMDYKPQAFAVFWAYLWAPYLTRKMGTAFDEARKQWTLVKLDRNILKMSRGK